MYAVAVGSNADNALLSSVLGADDTSTAVNEYTEVDEALSRLIYGKTSCFCY